jgi:hypothetical protein
MAKDRDITITSFSAGQTNTRAKKDFRMSSLLNIELDNFGDSISKHLLIQYFLLENKRLSCLLCQYY